MLWSLAAAASLFVVVYAGLSDIGRDRLRNAYAEFHETLMPSGASPVRPLDAREGRRLAETVRSLVAERDRLTARLDTLEHSVEDITGSIAKIKVAPPAIEPTVPEAAQPRAEEVTSSIAPPSEASLPPAPGVGKTEFGLDLGSASSVEALRTAWAAALKKHGALFDNLRPVVQMRERGRPGAVDFRLIAGPILNAATAARLCATVTASGSICAPTVFDGQRLAVR